MGSFCRRSWVVAVLAVALLGACSGGDGGSKGGAADGGTTVTDATGKGVSTTGAAGPYAFAVTGAEVQAMAAKAPVFPADVSAAVKAGLDTWLRNAVIGPLRTGQPSSGLEAAFTEPALARISAPGPDRAALVEEGGPGAGTVRQDRADAKLTALTGPGGEVVLVTAQIDVSHTVTSGGGALGVVRGGELVLVPDRGTWRIDAFNVVAKRDTKAPGK